MNKLIISGLSLAFLFMNHMSFGQNLPDTTKTLRIETIDGNIFTGYLLSEDSLILVISTQSYGELGIPLKQIKSRRVLTQVKKVGDEIWLPNPQSSRYFWAPNGYGLDAGTSYYQNIWILYNQFSFGVTDNFSIGAGMVPLFLFAGASTPFWIVPKLSLPVVKDRFNIGTGAFLGTIIGEDTGIFGLLYGTTTFGSRDKNISFGMAYGFADDAWLDIPIINVSGMVRTSPRGYFVTENYAITSEGEFALLLSVGGRSIIRNIGLDYSLWIPLGMELETFVAFPFLGITIPIGKMN